MTNHFKILFQKYIDQTINEEELIQFYSFLERSETDPELKAQLSELWQYQELMGKGKPAKKSKQRSLFKQDRWLEILMKDNQHHSRQVSALIKNATIADPRKDRGEDKKRFWWGWFKKFFVMALVIVAAGAWYYVSKPESATVTEMAYVEKTSAYGQKSTIPLPDGSVVKLNSGSKLIFPKLFEGDTREVTLEGEAFFEVARNENKPFVVRSGDLVTTVLGTSFNVKAYPEDQAIQVAVATGKVKVESEDGKSDAQFLTPNMVASYNPTVRKINISSYNNISNLLAWREGVLQFDEVPFTAVARTLEKWYGVKVTLENENIGQCLIYGEFKNQSLDKVMQALKHAIDIEYKLTTDGLTVTGKGCPT